MEKGRKKRAALLAGALILLLVAAAAIPVGVIYTLQEGSRTERKYVVVIDPGHGKTVRRPNEFGLARG